jgi:hypothetical protein
MILNKVRVIIEKILEENSYKTAIYIKTFPSFSVSAKEFMECAICYSNEHIKGLFKSNLLDLESPFSFVDMENVEKSLTYGKQLNNKQELILLFMEEKLEDILRKEKGLQYPFLIKEGLRATLEERVQYSLMELLFTRAIFENNQSSTSVKEELRKKSEKMAATLYIIKNIFSKWYADWNMTLIEPFKTELKNIQFLIDSPTFEMKKNIYLSDAQIFERLFPGQTGEIRKEIFK